jgi:hypothetical protein
MLKMAFCDRQTTASLGTDFKHFLKKIAKSLKSGQVNETYHSRDLVGGYRYSMVVSKQKGRSVFIQSHSSIILDTPLLLYMQNADEQASALFSDATCDLLLADGCKLIAEALQRLNIVTVNSPRPYIRPKYSIAYLMHINQPVSPCYQSI